MGEPGERGTAPTPLIGRDAELSTLLDLLRRHRVVTVAGPAGIGTTRLASEAARGLADTLPGGTHLVHVGALTHPDLVAPAVLGALGVRDAQEDPTARLVEHLEDAEMLLLLDGVAPTAPIAPGVLALVEALGSCPGVRLLLTSPDPLAIPGEQVLTLSPLSPDTAAALYRDRTAGKPPCGDTTEDAGTEPEQNALLDLMGRLGGLPLAVELAAARSDVTGSPPQSQGDFLDWIHQGLGAEQQVLWARASVFHGGTDLDGLVAVCAGAGLPAARVPEAAAAVEAWSVLRRDAGGRLSLPDALQAYGARRLAERGETEETLDRHLAYLSSLATRAAVELYGPQGPAWFHRLVAETDNTRAAVERCLVREDRRAQGIALVTSLQHFWVMAGRFGEARRWLTRLLPAPQEAGEAGGVLPDHLLAAGWAVAGRLAVLQGDSALGRGLLKAAADRARACGSRTWEAQALHGLGLVSVFWGTPEDAQPLLEEALRLHRDGEDPFGAPLALIQLATVHATLARPEAALACAEECLALSAAHGERWCAAMARWTLALGAWRRGRMAETRQHAREVLRLKQPFGDRLGMAMSLEVLAWTEAVQNRPERAALLVGAVEEGLHSVGGTLFHTLLDDHFRCVDRARGALGATAYATAHRRGRSTSFDEAVALALAPDPGEMGA